MEDRQIELDKIKDDIVLISKIVKDENWDGLTLRDFQMILYLGATLSSVFLVNEEWGYSFRNVHEMAYNSDLSDLLDEMASKQIVDRVSIVVYDEDLLEKYTILDSGIEIYNNIVEFNINIERRIRWLRILAKNLSIYGSSFLPKFMHVDPNIVSLGIEESIIDTSDSENNLTKDFFDFLKERGIKEFKLKNKKDEDFLMLFFKVQYETYTKGEVHGL